MLHREAPSAASDVFSFGKCVLEAASGEFAVSDSERPDTSAPSSSDLEDALAVQRPAGLTSLQWQLIEGMCSPDPSKRVNLIYVDEVLREFAENNDALVNLAAENVPYDLRKQCRLGLGFSFEGFLRHLEEKCRLQRYLHGHPGHVLCRLQDVLYEMVASKASHRAIHVKLFEQALFSFDFFLGNAVEGDSVRPRTRSQKASLKNGVLHQMVDELLGLGPMTVNWKVESVHRWDPYDVDGYQSDEVLAANTSNSNPKVKSNGDQKPGDDSKARLKRSIWVEKYDLTQKENSASEAITVDLGIHSNQPWFIPLY